MVLRFTGFLYPNLLSGECRSRQGQRQAPTQAIAAFANYQGLRDPDERWPPPAGDDGVGGLLEPSKSRLALATGRPCCVIERPHRADTPLVARWNPLILSPAPAGLFFETSLSGAKDTGAGLQVLERGTGIAALACGVPRIPAFRSPRTASRQGDKTDASSH
jgi:hypothetical protein